MSQPVHPADREAKMQSPEEPMREHDPSDQVQIPDEMRDLLSGD